jgi:ribosomal protein S10
VEEAHVAGPKIRIKLRAYDHRMLDVAARDIVEHVTRTGRGGRAGAADRAQHRR